MRLIGNGTHHSTMRMNPELFGITADEKKALLKGIADVTGYIRKSNIAFGQEGAHRVYIEIPGNWYMVIDIANMLKAIDVPVQTIDFGHPNFRDGKLVKYNEGKPNFWKKEHQVKIFANEFLAVGFNIQHKQEALEKYSEELLEFIDPAKTHKFYWEKPIRRSVKPHHPGENDPYLPEEIGEPQNFELIKILLQLITQTSSHESLKNSLSSLANENLQALTTSASLEGLKRVEALMRENLDNGKEEFWQQKVFNENQWVLAQIFSCPCTIYAQKAFVGGKSLDNKGGNVCDFIYRNKMTQNVALIEIKTPCTEIVGKPYRETYSMSLDMSGAVNQVLNYRDELQKNFSTLTRDLEEADTVRAFSPKCVVVIGKISTLNAKQQKAFELYRSSFNNLTIITFDELHQKICDLMSVFKEDSPRPVDSLMDEFSIIDEDYPI